MLVFNRLLLRIKPIARYCSALSQSTLCTFFCCLWISQAALSQVNNPRLTVNASENGYHCTDFSFDPQSFPEEFHWEAQWIGHPDKELRAAASEWIHQASQIPLRRLVFRKSFTCDSIALDTRLAISADVLYRVYLNGCLVGRGPANIGSDYEDTRPPQHWFYSVYDISQWLRAGENHLCVEVFTRAFCLSETTSGIAGLLCQVFQPGGSIVLKTDSSWRVAHDEAFGLREGVFYYDATRELQNRMQGETTGNDWTNAIAVDKPVSNFLSPNRLPNCTHHPLKPRLVTEGRAGIQQNGMVCDSACWLSEGEYLFEFPVLLTGRIDFGVLADAGDTLVLVPLEKLTGRPNRTLIYTGRGEPNHFESPWLTSFKYLKIRVSTPDSVQLNSLQAILSTYPVQYKGDFACSDPFLTQLWKIARWSTQLCMNDMYFDSPAHQEPLACTGDYLIESASSYFAFGDQWLTRQDIWKTAQFLQKNGYDAFHTSYSLLWVQMVRDYFDRTRDTAFVLSILPHVNALQEVFSGYLGKEMLLSEAPDYMFLDWVKIDDFNAHHPPAVIGTGYLTAFYYNSLMLAAGFNQWAGNMPEADRFTERARQIKDAINRLLWDSSKELYRDGIPFLSKRNPTFWRPADKEIETFTPHFNALCVLYDIAPEQYHSKIIQYVVNQKAIEIQPYFMYFVLAATRHAGLVNQYGGLLLDKWRKGYDKETMTLKENWSDTTELGYKGDYSHAWGGAPLSFLSSVVLGISPSPERGVDFVFQPCVINWLSWAKGTIPGLIGDISIEWIKSENEVGFHVSTTDTLKIKTLTDKLNPEYLWFYNGLPIRDPSELILNFPGKHTITYRKSSSY